MAFQSTTTDPDFNEKLLSTFETPIDFSPGHIEPVDIVEGNEAIMQGTGEIDILAVHILDGEAHPRHRFRTGKTYLCSTLQNQPTSDQSRLASLYPIRWDIFMGQTQSLIRYWKALIMVYTFIFAGQTPILSGVYDASVAIFDQHHIKLYIWHNRLYNLK